MSLAKERMVQDSHLGLIQACSFYENVYGGSSIQVMDPSLGLHEIDNYPQILLEEEGGSAKTNRSATWVKSFNSNRLPLLSDTSNVNCSPFVLQTSNSPPREAQSLIFNFKAGSDRSGHSSGSLLSFEKKEDYSTWADTVNQNIQWKQPSHNDGTAGSRLSEDLSCFETACSYDSMNSSVEEIQHGDERFGWLYSVAAAANGVDPSGREEVFFHKRPHVGSEMQASKKQCNAAARKAKPKSIPSKDPQSIAAKNRRERISERLKVLQELVPNGSKVDLVTMLEKAISYVKFLQLQVKVLATDEFWPAQGGKAPEVGQVKEAIDEILSSHKNRNPTSKCERPFG